jgi:glucuronate isomerase
MKDFFGDKLFLNSRSAEILYSEVKDLPIIDYHCHLNQHAISTDENFCDIGELWLKHDHYKWRAMRLNGVDEKFITGNANYHDKFIKFAEIMPNLIGNPVYYWCHLELNRLFGITEPLNILTAESIYVRANEMLKKTSVLKMLEKFNVEYIATTNDPTDDLSEYKKYGQTLIAPTFRPDRLYSLEDSYIKELEVCVGKNINTLDDLLCAITQRLDYFVAKGCVISDHGFDRFPEKYADKSTADALFNNRGNLSEYEKDALFGFLLVWLTKEYAKRNVIMQIHIAVTRDVNALGYKVSGKDSGYDVISDIPSVKSVLNYFQQVLDCERPKTIIYTLNDATLSSIACLTGAFKNVVLGAAWWFNDTVDGIKRNLSIISEYSCLGVIPGMLTDSRSFSHYVRFEFFRRIFCDYVGEKVEKGEYDVNSAKELVKNVCYYNAKRMINNG